MKRGILLIILMACSIGLYAHPHMFIDNALTFDYNGLELRGFYIEWLFDESFSAMISMDYDQDKNGHISSAETSAIQNGAFQNLRNYDYFLYIYLDGESLAIPDAEEFTAWLDDVGRLGYRFFIPVYKAKTRDFSEIKVAVYDQNFYCDIEYIEESPVKVNPQGAESSVVNLSQNSDLKIEYDNSSTSGGRSGVNYTGEAFPYVAELSF